METYAQEEVERTELTAELDDTELPEAGKFTSCFMLYA